MYCYQIVVTVYQDVYLDDAFFFDINGLIYLAPFFILILIILYTVRTQIFDRIYGIDLSELNETDVNVFSTGLSSKDEAELASFRQEQKFNYTPEPTEDYYRKL